MAKTLQEQFTLTRHAQDRMLERFPDAMKDILFEKSAAIRNRMMRDFLLNATVENRAINDTMFMQFLQEKYGFEKNFKFFANQNMLFIGVIDNGANCIVTVVNRSDYSSKYLRPVERKLQKKPNTFKAQTWMNRPKSKLSPKLNNYEYLETDFDE